jgi:hypothetical protein
MLNVRQLRYLAERIKQHTIRGDTYTALHLCKALDDVEPASWKYMNFLSEYKTKYEGRPKLEKYGTYDSCVGWRTTWHQLPVENPTLYTLGKAWQCLFTLELYEAEDSFQGNRGMKSVEIAWVVTDEDHFKPLIEKLIEPRLMQHAYYKAEADELAEIDRKHKAAIDRRLSAIMRVTER